LKSHQLLHRLRCLLLLLLPRLLLQEPLHLLPSMHLLLPTGVNNTAQTTTCASHHSQFSAHPPAQASQQQQQHTCGAVRWKTCVRSQVVQATVDSWSNQ
jgi:hypothetical protein